MEVILVLFWILIAISAIWTLIIGINAIAIAWKASRMMNTSSVFYAILNKTLEGNIITILIIYIISLPIWVLLSLIIASSPKHYIENPETNLISNNQISESNEINPVDHLDFKYWYVNNQNSVGPLNCNEIRELSLQNNTLIYRSDMSDWKPLNEFDELS